MLTPEELKVSDLLAEAFIAFDALPFQRDHDRPEFIAAIHSAQRIVMARSARRLHPDIYGSVPDWTVKALRMEGEPKW